MFAKVRVEDVRERDWEAEDVVAMAGNEHVVMLQSVFQSARSHGNCPVVVGLVTPGVGRGNGEEVVVEWVLRKILSSVFQYGVW